ncbi:MAG: outer membrane beta-barrel protein [Bacteroidota bacterium]
MKQSILKISAVVLLALGAGINANAQISVGVTGGVGIPMGDMGDDAKGGIKTGFGGELQGRYHLNDNMAVGLSLGYYSWGTVEIPGFTTSFTTMPIMGGFDYYFSTDDFKPFAGIELGYTTWSSEVSGEIFGIPFEASSSGGGLALAPVIGASYAINDQLDVFGRAKYFYGMTEDTGTGAPNLTYIGINAGVSMKF